MPSLKKTYSKYVKLLPIIIILVIAQTACNSGKAPDSQSLRIGLASDITTLDRAKVSNVATVSVLSSIYENLLQVEPGTTRVQPALATDWSTSNDGLQLVFQLRQGVRFHNGKELGVEDVVYSFNRFLDPETAAPTRQWLSNIAKIEKSGEHTVKIELKRPDPNILVSLAVLPGIVPEGVKDLTQEPISTGPFRFIRWDRSREVLLERFRDYWGGVSSINLVSFRILPEEVARLSAFRNGEIDILPSSSVSPALLKALVQEGYILQEVPTAGMQYMGFDLTARPYSIKAFRAAVAHAIDRSALVEKLLEGHAILAKGPVPQVFPEHFRDLPSPEYNLELARSLLKEADLKENDKTLDLSYGTEYPWNDQLAQILQSDLEKLGLKINLNRIEWGAFIGNLLNKKYSFYTVDLFAGNGDYRFFLFDLFESKSPLNLFRYDNPIYDKIIRGINDIETSKRSSAAATAQQVLAEDYAAVFLFATKQGILTRPGIQGVQPGILQEINLRNARRVPTT